METPLHRRIGGCGIYLPLTNNNFAGLIDQQPSCLIRYERAVPPRESNHGHLQAGQYVVVRLFD